LRIAEVKVYLAARAFRYGRRRGGVSLIADLQWNEQGLIPAVVQDASTGRC
jgi:hypothetical protein